MSQSPTTATMITPITIHAARFPLLIMVRMAQPPSSQVPADHLLKFSDPLLPVDQGAIVGELKLPQSPVGLDQVQKIGPTCPIARWPASAEASLSSACGKAVVRYRTPTSQLARTFASRSRI